MPWSRLAHPELVGCAARRPQLNVRLALRGSPSAACRRSSSSPCCALSHPGRRRPSLRSSGRPLVRSREPAFRYPDSENSQPVGDSLIWVERTRSAPPSAWRSPSIESAPLAIQGVVSGPTFTRPIAASSQVLSGCPRSRSRAARPSARRAAAPQLWPTMPRQPSSSTLRPFTLRRPLKSAAGVRAERLRARHARAVHPAARQMEAAAARHPRSRAPRSRRRHPSSPPPPARAGRTCCPRSRSSRSPPRRSGSGLRDLRGQRALRRVVEEREPERRRSAARRAACAPCSGSRPPAAPTGGTPCR